MNASLKVLLAAFLPVFLASTADANPELFVTYEGVSGGGNHQWQVAVAPDPDFFSDTTSGFGSSLAVELAFAIEGSTIASGSIIENDLDWPADNPGNNPFTNDVTFGMWLSGSLDQAFGAFGSNVFLSGFPAPLFSFQTVGSDPTTVFYGAAASGHPTKGTIIGQTGQNFPVEFAASNDFAFLSLGGAASGDGGGFHQFEGYTGSVSSVPEPSALISALVATLIGLIAPPRRRG